MSQFFEDLEAAVRKVASNVSTGVTVAAREQKAKEAFQKLGRMYYRAVKAGERPKGEAFDEQVAKIEALLQEINDLRSNEQVTAEDHDFVDAD